MSTPLLVALSIINVLFALMVLFFMKHLEWKKRDDRPAIVWFVVMFVVLAADASLMACMVHAVGVP